MSVDGSLEDLWVEGIQSLCHRRRNPREMFITISSLQNHWTEQRLASFIQTMNLEGLEESQISLIQQHFLRTLSILIWIRWNRWPEFGQIFLPTEGREDRSDERIPWRSDELQPILGSFSDSFLFHQPVFCPVEIQEGEDIEHNDDWRLPFINEESENVGAGAYGRVTREVIAVGQLRFHPEDGPSILNSVRHPSCAFIC